MRESALWRCANVCLAFNSEEMVAAVYAERPWSNFASITIARSEGCYSLAIIQLILTTNRATGPGTIRCTIAWPLILALKDNSAGFTSTAAVPGFSRKIKSCTLWSP